MCYSSIFCLKKIDLALVKGQLPNAVAKSFIIACQSARFQITRLDLSPESCNQMQ